MSLDRVLRPTGSGPEARLRELEARVRVLETAPGFAAGTAKGGTTRWQDLAGLDAVTIGLLPDSSYGIQSSKFVALTVSTGTDLNLSGALTADHATLVAALNAASAALSAGLTADRATLGQAGGASSGLTVGPSGDRLTQLRLFTPSLTPSSVAANSAVEQSFSVTGLSTADKLLLNGPAPTANCVPVHARASAANTLAVVFANLTGGALTPAAGTYFVLAIRS